MARAPESFKGFWGPGVFVWLVITGPVASPVRRVLQYFAGSTGVLSAPDCSTFRRGLARGQDLFEPSFEVIEVRPYFLSVEINGIKRALFLQACGHSLEHLEGFRRILAGDLLSLVEILF